MKLPNKVTCYKQSLLYKFPIVLNELQQGVCDAYALYNATKNIVENVAEFIDILDCLFALGKIDFDAENRSIYYVA